MSDEDEDTEGSDEGLEEVIETFDCMTFNSDCDQQLEWTTERPRTRKRGNIDIIKKPGGLTSSSEHIETMKEAFDLFITNDIKEIILK